MSKLEEQRLIRQAEIGATIRMRRKQLRMTQESLALYCGLGKIAITRIETGKTNPSLHTLAEIAQALGLRLSLGEYVIAPRHFATGNDEPENEDSK